MSQFKLSKLWEHVKKREKLQVRERKYIVCFIVSILKIIALFGCLAALVGSRVWDPVPMHKGGVLSHAPMEEERTETPRQAFLSVATLHGSSSSASHCISIYLFKVAFLWWCFLMNGVNCYVDDISFWIKQCE